MVVEMCHVLGQHSIEVAAGEDQPPVQQFAAESSDLALGDRVRSWCPHGCARDADVFADEYGIEYAGEFASRSQIRT
jgi:hypothetical protein